MTLQLNAHRGALLQCRSVATWRMQTHHTHQSHRTATKHKHVSRRLHAMCQVREGEGVGAGLPFGICDSLWAMAKRQAPPCGVIRRRAKWKVSLANKTRQIGIGSCLNVSRTFRDSFTRFRVASLSSSPSFYPSPTCSFLFSQLETPSNWPGQRDSQVMPHVALSAR